MSQVNIRLWGLPADIAATADLLAALEEFLASGDTAGLRAKRFQILSRSALRKDRGESKFVRQYLKVEVGENTK